MDQRQQKFIDPSAFSPNPRLGNFQNNGNSEGQLQPHQLIPPNISSSDSYNYSNNIAYNMKNQGFLENQQKQQQFRYSQNDGAKVQSHHFSDNE